MTVTVVAANEAATMQSLLGANLCNNRTRLEATNIASD
jgi:hypothetical protein